MVNVRGVSTSDAMAAIPKPGEAVMLGLGPQDTILLADEGAAP
jgi:putative spermidine/putrescine transport system ATP-binding protein